MTYLQEVRRLGSTLSKVAGTRALIVEVQLALFQQAQRDGKLSTAGEELHNTVEVLRNSIRAYRG